MHNIWITDLWSSWYASARNIGVAVVYEADFAGPSDCVRCFYFEVED